MELFIKNISQTIFDQLGPCHLESVYQKAFLCELNSMKISHTYEVNVPVYYNSTHLVGTIRADVVIEGTCVIELKSCPSVKNEHLIQAYHYMERLPTVTEAYVVNFPNKCTAVEPEIVKVDPEVFKR